MQLENALFSFLQQQRDLVTDHRPIRLRLAHPTQMLEDVLLPQRVYGTESICGSLEYRILCVALDAFLPLKELIALPVAIDFVTDRGDLRSVCGIVTEAAAGDSDGGLASYQLVLRDALSILEKRNNTRVFRNKNEVEIVKVILDEWRQSNAILGTCFNYETDELFDAIEYPQREFTMQYNESDAAFIRRLLKRRGIAWYFRADGEDSPAHTLVLFNNAESIQPNAAGIVRYHRDNATEERDTITAWCAVRTLQPGSVTRHSWDYMNPQARDFMTTTATSGVDQGTNGNEMSASLDDYLVQAPHIGDDHEDLCQLGQLAMSRHDYESKCFYGEGSVRDFCAGEYFTLIEHPEIDTHGEADRDFVVTSLHVAAHNNLPKALAERVERLFARNRWMYGQADAIAWMAQGSVRTRIQFTAVRRNIEIVPAWDARAEVPLAQLQSAIVVGPEGEEVHCDELGRVKIRFAAMRNQDHAHADGTGASDTDSDSAWVRVASSWAGSGVNMNGQCGFLALPRAGSEVAVAFLNGDPDRPLIVGQLFNPRGHPPFLSPSDSLPLTRHLSGIRSGEIQGSRANQLRFDDTNGQISAQLASEHGQSELNLGFLTQTTAASGSPARGEGAELRTVLRLALRGLEGLLISTWKNLDQNHQHMAAREFHQLISASEAMMAEMAEIAEASQALGAKIDATAELADAFSSWLQSKNDGDQVIAAPIAITSPDGIGIVTPKALTSYAGRHMNFVTEENFQISAAGQFVVTAENGLSLFSEQSGIKAIAQAGQISIQSQSDDTEVHSAKGIRMTALEGSLSCTATEIVLMASDGSFIKIGDGITLGSNGSIQHHGQRHLFKGSKTMRAQYRQSTSKQRKRGRELTVELVDPDGRHPESEPVQLYFAATGESRKSTTNAGSAKFSSLPSGQFTLVQTRRVS